MKFMKKSNKIFFFIIFLLSSIFIFSKETIGYEEEVKKITSKLRCMTCQNQTIYDSDADFSKDIKKIVKNKLQNNATEKEIIDFLIKRYGEYIVFEPQKNKRNIFLWYFPFVFMAISLAFFIFRIKKN
tara:strand:+ start:238 stop:621 length:384 start_codon:yes stop_codon:yes gene_type:complete